MTQVDLKELLRDVENYAEQHKGKIYAPIDHPAFAHVPSNHGPERFEPIRAHLPTGAKTALDVGTHWGYFAHHLEGMGLKVTAAEISNTYLPFLRRIKDVYEDDFEILAQSVLEIDGSIDYDVVLALNIFHHFIKTESIHAQFVDFLSRLQCTTMFFQSHNVKEGQMASAFRNYAPEEFCAFIVEHVPTLANFEQIATFGMRPMYMLSS